MSDDQQGRLEGLTGSGDAASRLDPATLEEARRLRLREAAERSLAAPKPLVSGHTLWAEIVAATIEGQEIHVGLRIHGQVQRPEALATAQAVVLHLTVPATVEG